ncbi:MAG: hypothetical protein AVDCRST_MAG45-2280, partial [uncultured Solirubrobacterales bacterium]
GECDGRSPSGGGAPRGGAGAGPVRAGGGRGRRARGARRRGADDRLGDARGRDSGGADGDLGYRLQHLDAPHRDRFVRAGDGRIQRLPGDRLDRPGTRRAPRGRGRPRRARRSRARVRARLPARRLWRRTRRRGVRTLPGDRPAQPGGQRDPEPQRRLPGGSGVDMVVCTRDLRHRARAALGPHTRAARRWPL